MSAEKAPVSNGNCQKKKKSKWLVSKGITAFDADDFTVVSQYLNKKWVFLGARIKPAAAGLVEMPPLTVRFPAPVPVYPVGTLLEQWMNVLADRN